MISVTVTYSDREITLPVTEWPTMQGHDVQAVAVGKPGNTVVFKGSSLYWVYTEDENFVAGSGSVRYDKNLITEIVIAPDGMQRERQVEYMADLVLNQVKLGWWKEWPRPTF